MMSYSIWYLSLYDFYPVVLMLWSAAHSVADIRTYLLILCTYPVNSVIDRLLGMSRPRLRLWWELSPKKDYCYRLVTVCYAIELCYTVIYYMHSCLIYPKKSNLKNEI